MASRRVSGFRVSPNRVGVKNDMTGYKQYLKVDQTDWLLEEDNPSVRYFALRELLDKPEDAPDVKRAKKIFRPQRWCGVSSPIKSGAGIGAIRIAIATM